MRKRSTIKSLLNYSCLLLELCNMRKCFIRNFDFCSDDIENYISYIFTHSSTSTYENNTIVLENMLLQPIFILIKYILNILFDVWVPPTLSQLHLQNFILFILLPLLFVVIVNLFILYSKIQSHIWQPYFIWDYVLDNTSERSYAWAVSYHH